MHAPRLNLRETAPEAMTPFVAADRSLRDGPLDATVRELVKIRASQLNGCAYCVDMHTAEARGLGELEHRLHQVAVWRESNVFTAAERAALAYTDEATRLGDEGVTDEVWDELTGHYEPAELGHLVAQVALINAFNRIAVPLRTPPPVREG